ncbi:MAG: hypothetical protein WC953_12620 [Pseudomonas sp.]
MLESTRLDYLAAMGVVGWVPRQALANAAFRLPPELPVTREAPGRAPETRIELPLDSNRPAGTEASQTSQAAEAIKASIAVRSTKLAPQPAPVLEQQVAESEVKAEPLEAFYLQLWMAGPCALLIETQEPGLESASPALHLLKNILRAVRLPEVPHFYADFHWPLIRNRQFDRSAPAASLALQAFMQGRLENKGIVSIGCFGTYPRLLLGAGLDLSEPAASEQLIEHLPPTWFAPALDSLLSDPAGKAQLWQQLKRIMSRWQAEQ